MNKIFLILILTFGIIISVINLGAQCGTDADLSLIYTVSEMTPDSGQSVTYTIVVNNAGPCTASDIDVRVTGQGSGGNMTGPGNKTIVSYYPLDLLWEGFALASGSSATLTYWSQSVSPGYFSSFAQVNASLEPDPDSTPGNGDTGEDDGAGLTINVFHGACYQGNTAPAPPNVSIINSNCDNLCISSNGSIIAPINPCPYYRYIIQYEVNGGPWTSDLPVYDQDGPSQTIRTRCQCLGWSENFTPSSSPVTTVPGVCTTPVCEITGEDAVCPNSSYKVYSATQGMSNYSWSINGSGTIVGSSTDPTVSVAAGTSGTYTVSVTITNGDGCASSCNKTVSINSTFTTVNEGEFDDENTWLNNCMPPNPVPPGSVVNISDNITNPQGSTLINNGIINIDMGVSFINFGTYGGNGTFNGNFINNGVVNPGD